MRERTVELVALKSRRLNGPELVFLRKSLDLSQRAMAALIGLTPDYLGKAERGETRMKYAPERLVRILAVLHCTPAIVKAVARAERHREAA